MRIIRLKLALRTTSARRACPTEPEAPKITAVPPAIFFSNRKANTLWQYLTHGFAATSGRGLCDPGVRRENRIRRKFSSLLMQRRRDRGNECGSHFVG